MPGKVEVHLVGEDHGNQRKPEAGDGAELHHVGQPRHLDLDGEGDLLFHFFGRHAGPGGIDLHLDVGDVREGVHLELQRRINPVGHQSRQGDENQEAMPQAALNDSFNHLQSPCRPR